MPVESAESEPNKHVAVKTSYWLRFLQVSITNEKEWPLYVLLSRAKTVPTIKEARDARDTAAVKMLKELESQGEVIAVDIGPDGQWTGVQLPTSFEQEIRVYDPLVFTSVAILKPSAARPPSITPQLFAMGRFETYMPPVKSADEIKADMEALAKKIENTVMDMSQQELLGDALNLDDLRRNARELFRLFDQDRSNSIDFDGKRAFATVEIASGF
ncbi:hypothetical protein PINS_up013354 [Pythium insidiosum]|nr:hypothetical protein PINS_up013354 [Pythium insidiosum]